MLSEDRVTNLTKIKEKFSFDKIIYKFSELKAQKKTVIIN